MARSSSALLLTLPARAAKCTAAPFALLLTVAGLLPACFREREQARAAPPTESAGEAAGVAGPPALSAAGSTATTTTSGATTAAAPPLSLTAATLAYQGDGRLAYDAYRTDDFSRASALLDKIFADPKRQGEQRSVAVLRALTLGSLRRYGEAARAYQAAALHHPRLTDWLTYQAARAHYLHGQSSSSPASYTTAAELLDKVAPNSIVAMDAALLRADLARATGTPAQVAEAYRSYLATFAKPIRRAEARFHLGRALLQTPATASEGRELLRAVMVEEPVSRWGTEASALLAPLRWDEKGHPLSPHERMTRGKALFDAMRNPASAADFAAALASKELSVSERCTAGYHLGQSWFKERKRELAIPAFRAAIDACKRANDKDLGLRSAYQAGRSHVILGQAKEAIAMFELAKTIDTTNTITDDAWLRQAEAFALLPDDAKADATLAEIPKRFPGGDMRGEALWRLGWRAWRRNDVRAAISWWEQQIAAVPLDDNFWAEGQAQYWLGRAHLALGDRPRAIARFEEAIATYPLSYYALLSLNRLGELDPALVERVLATKRFDPRMPATEPTFAAEPQWQTPGFARAMEFLRLGLGEPAEAELRQLGLTPPPDRKRVDDPAQRDRLWATAFLYDRAGRFATSHWSSRWHTLDYRRHWPDDRWRAYWQVAYPRAFAPLLAEHAKKNDLPFAMQIAIVREESAFTPELESFANAIGLTQMILPTARRFAKGTGLTVSRETLQDPVTNVTIGSRFLGYLYQHWDRFEPLVPPSYNAGEGAVRRALAQRGTWPTDEFIEGIVTDETRLYAKRVLASYFVYSWLYEQRVPTIPNKIPPALLSK